MTSAFFVYGTLKQGHLRDSVWPSKPNAIEPGVIRANLFDLGPYPGIAPGDGWVLGELWTFSSDAMPPVIEALDRAEGYSALGKTNYYNRLIVDVHLADQRIERAFTYFFGSPSQLAISRQILPSDLFEGYCCASWPDSLARVPNSFEEEL